jgi:uncharacterized protein (DUF4415 family)
LSIDHIDTSDIPEPTPEQMGRAIRGQMYRPIKKPVTMRLDADVVAWLKQQGPGYQTRANSLLRKEMVRAYLARQKSNLPTSSRWAGANKRKKTSRPR